jgi:hypothetical protein
MDALQALTLNVPTQDLMLNHLMLATIDPDTQPEWELVTAPRADTPTTADLHFRGVQMQSPRTTRDIPVTEGTCYQHTPFTISLNQGQ